MHDQVEEGSLEARNDGLSEFGEQVKSCGKANNIKLEMNKIYVPVDTGCSLNIVFFPIFKKYSGLWPFSVFPRCQCVYTHQAGRTPALQQN